MNRSALILLLGLTLGLAACSADEPDTVAGPDSALSSNGDSDTGGDEPDGGSPSDTDADVSSTTSVIGTIEIMISHPDTDPVRYTISCLGDTFTVTPEVEGIDGSRACDQLADAGVLDRLRDGPPANQVCTEIYGGPDQAIITGELDSETINTVIDRANGCGIDDWDRLLGAVLMPAVGVAG